MINFNRAYAVFLRYMILLWGNPQRLVQIFVWGSFDVILWGFLTRYLNAVGSAGFSFVPTLLGGIILSDFLSRVQQGTTTPALEDIWSSNLLNYFASPLRIGEYIVGLIGAAIVTTTLSMTVMLLIAMFFGFSIVTYGFSLAGFVLVLFLFGVCLGTVGAAIVLRYGPSSEWFIWPMVYVLTPFIGVFYPLSVLPQWMHAISYLLPPSYVFEGMRAVVIGTPSSLPPLWIGMVLAVVDVALAALFFRRMYRTVVRLGLLARYSAEGA